MTKDQKLIDKLKTISVHTAPPWAAPLQDLGKTINDPDANIRIVEESQRLKESWTKTGKWAKWERERRAAVQKNKPEWIKRGSLPAERDEATKG